MKERKETLWSFLYRKLHKNLPPLLLLLLINNYYCKADSEVVFCGVDSEYSFFEFEGAVLSMMRV